MKKQMSTSIRMICFLLLLQAAIATSYGQAKMTSSADCLAGSCICVQGSLDLAKVSYSGSSSPDKTRIGFNLGVFVVHPLPTDLKTGGLLLKGGLEFIQKGTKFDYGGGDNETLTLGYLEIPIDIMYEYKLPNCGGIFGGLGPYFAYGLGGKDKYTSGGMTITTNSFSDSTGKRFDAGLHITAGYRMSCTWSASIAYEIGLVNIYNNQGSGYSYTAKNNVWSFNVAYCLGDLLSKKK
jgi:hypothetical protein